MSEGHSSSSHRRNWPLILTEGFFFNIRWSLGFFYLGMVAVLYVLCRVFFREVGELFHSFSMSKLAMNDAVVAVMELLDLVMIANLVSYMIPGSWHSFVRKDHAYPQMAVSSGMLKVKISGSVMSISMIHLIKVMFDADHMSFADVGKHVMIFTSFILGAWAFMKMEKDHTWMISQETKKEGKDEAHH